MTLLACAGLVLLMLPTWKATFTTLVERVLLIGFLVATAFGVAERWPARLPRWFTRWAFQIVAVAIAVPAATLIVYFAFAAGDPAPWWKNPSRLFGFILMTVFGLLVAPWIAMSALLRQINGEASRQALAVDLLRSELARSMLDARLRLLNAQIEPHFLFNTLANVRELVDTSSPRASTVLGSLITYLREVVPRLNATTVTMEDELALVRAYLEVMKTRMPDRLDFDIQAPEDASPVRCAPTTILTLVENAVRHGIDPSEDGGRIDVRVRVSEGRCRVDVVDTGVGLRAGGEGAGTGLSNLEQRMHFLFGDAVQLHLRSHEPRGVKAEVEFPALHGAG